MILLKPIATITFHWANNYGAVLQAFALQKYLINSGFDAEIINYLPLRTVLANIIIAAKKHDFAFFKKTKSFNRFRKKELIIGKKKYYTNKSLFACKDIYSAIIAGSDQIWNMSFTKKAEGKPTLSYYLNFAGYKTKRISYAASFGTNKLDNEVAKLIAPELNKYFAISVRETSAVGMLNDIGISAKCVVDPTLLLATQDYVSLAEKGVCANADSVFTYIIHSNQTTAKKISQYICEKFSDSKYTNEPVSCSIYEWLYKIKTSKFVVTNSFHGTVFALIFHVPFITVAIPNSGMNDRLTTLLEETGLSDRLFCEFDEESLNIALNSEICWSDVDSRLEILKAESRSFIMGALKC